MATHDSHPAINHGTFTESLEYLRHCRALPGPVTLSPSELSDVPDVAPTAVQSALYSLHTRLEWLADAWGGRYRVADSRAV